MSASASLLFYVCAVGAVFGALATVMAVKPLRAAMALLVNIVSIAGLYLTLHAELLAALQILVYAGAVVVLFVFVIMIIGPGIDREELADHRDFNTRVLNVVFVGVISVLILFGIARTTLAYVEVPESFGSVEEVGRALYVGAMVPFELVSITLLVAILGAVAIARGRTREEAEAARARRQEREASEAERLERERRLSAEVSAHGGH